MEDCPQGSLAGALIHMPCIHGRYLWVRMIECLINCSSGEVPTADLAGLHSLNPRGTFQTLAARLESVDRVLLLPENL